jgi:hypothetical protein
MRTERRDRWPGWLQPLRLDPFTRERVRRRIIAEAADLLRARRAGSWWLVADRWATALLPLAAALALVFATLAHRASALPGIAQAPPTVDELLESANPNAPPTLLTSATEPGIDQLLGAAVTHQAP